MSSYLFEGLTRAHMIFHLLPCRLYTNLKANEEWMADLHAADVIFISTHSQGCVVSTHLLDRLIRDKHIRPPRDSVCVTGADSFPSSVGIDLPPDMKPQRICCLALCGIHHGPLRYLGSSTLVQPYIQVCSSMNYGFLDILLVLFH